MKDRVKKQQLFYLFLGNFSILFVGMGLFPILPLYAAEFGAGPSQIGLYLGVVYTAIAIGSLSTGWLVERLPRRSLLVAAGSLGVPALALLSQATAFWQIMVLTSVVWFSGGVGLALISAFTGLLADGKSRGKLFGLMSLGVPLGALIGGAVVSRLVAWQGYPLMFAVLSTVWAVLPLVGLLGLKEKPQSRPTLTKARGSQAQLGKSFYLLLFVSLLSSTGIAMSRFGISIDMKLQGFDPGAAASTSAVGGLIVVPVTLLILTISDRVKRRNFLLSGYLLVAGGALVLGASTRLWHFWSASTLILLAIGITSTASAALVTDLLAPKALGQGLALLNTSNYAASILSFTASGFLVDQLGVASIHLLAVALPVVSVALLSLQGLQRTAPAFELKPENELQCAVIPCP